MKILYALSLFCLLASMVASAAACVCTADYTPVCGTNGQTYSNMCRLRCAGVQLKRKGFC